MLLSVWRRSVFLRQPFSDWVGFAVSGTKWGYRLKDRDL